jgi:glycosyltransferase involved in cell wall biosynthesis
MKTYKLAYLTIEDISSGLFRTQVFNLLLSLTNNFPEIEIKIYCINGIWRLNKNIKSIKKLNLIIKNKNSKIKIIYLPFLPPLRNALKSAFYLKLVIQYLRLIFSFIGLGKFNAIHIRSYWPLLAISYLGLKNIIFDPRSLWIHESVSSGDLVEGSNTHKLLLSLERVCVESSKIISAVSQPMVEHYKTVSTNSHIKLIPIIFSESDFFYDARQRASVRYKLNIESNLVYVYSGSFGQSGVNIQAIFQLFELILEEKNSRLLILTNEKESVINKLIGDLGDNSKNVIVKSLEPQELNNFLSAADIGVHALPPQKDSASRLGTKVVEYWACGLPVLVNQNVGAAAAHIQKFNELGDVIDLGIDSKSFHILSRRLKSLDRNKISKYALDNFSAQIISPQYLEAYICMDIK